jgi:hypothetical protein
MRALLSDRPYRLVACPVEGGILPIRLAGSPAGYLRMRSSSVIDNYGPPAPRKKRSFSEVVKSAEVIVSLLVGLGAIVAFLVSLALPSVAPAPPPAAPSAAAQPDPVPPSADRSKRQYIAEADALCMAAYAQNGQAHQQYGASIDGVQQTNAILESLAGEWAGVVRPSGDEEAIDEIIDLLRMSTDAGAKAIFAYRNADNASYQRYVAQSDHYLKQHEQAARAYGHKVCGQY